MRTRKVVKSAEQLQNYVSATNGKDNITTTVYGFRELKPKGNRCEYNTAVVPHFVVDLDKDRLVAEGMDDDEAGQQCSEEAWRLSAHLLTNGWRHAVWFTGGGFHIWVALDKPYIPSSGAQVSAVKEAGMTVVNDWIHQLDLFCSDPAVPFDTSGLIRIPNSNNAKRGYWSIPLTSEEITHNDIWSIMELAMNPRSGKFTYGELGVELDVKKPSERKAVFNHDSPVMDIPTISMNGVKILPCLNAAACQVGGNPSHDARVQLVKYLAKRLRNFYPLDRVNQEDVMKHTEQIVEFIKTLEWADFNEGVTRYQVSTIMNKDYPQTCSMLFKKGHCVGKCRYWDKTGAIGDA